jgi:hypothetical protein
VRALIPSIEGVVNKQDSNAKQGRRVIKLDIVAGHYPVSGSNGTENTLKESRCLERIE